MSTTPLQSIYSAPAETAIWQLLASVNDPEVPVLSVLDLGVVRKVNLSTSGQVTITITPTYSGCPAMDMIALHIKMALLAAGYNKVEIVTVLSPAWTTDWMTDAGKDKLLAYGIAPPVGKALDEPYLEDLHPACPQCQSIETQLASQFGSTACKALYVCQSCKEPFDYFKCH